MTMTTGAFSQDSYAADVIKTSAGDVEMYFIGHGSLMFKVDEYCIHIDPVSSSGSYDRIFRRPILSW